MILIMLRGCCPMELNNVNYWKSLINIGLSRMLILKVLSKGSNHGYGILKELEILTCGCCIPTYGTIYPILKELNQHGYAEVREDKQLKGAQKDGSILSHLKGLRPIR